MRIGSVQPLLADVRLLSHAFVGKFTKQDGVLDRRHERWGCLAIIAEQRPCGFRWQLADCVAQLTAVVGQYGLLGNDSLRRLGREHGGGEALKFLRGRHGLNPYML